MSNNTPQLHTSKEKPYPRAGFLCSTHLGVCVDLDEGQVPVEHARAKAGRRRWRWRVVKFGKPDELFPLDLTIAVGVRHGEQRLVRRTEPHILGQLDAASELVEFILVKRAIAFGRIQAALDQGARAKGEEPVGYGPRRTGVAAGTVVFGRVQATLDWRVGAEREEPVGYEPRLAGIAAVGGAADHKQRCQQRGAKVAPPRLGRSRGWCDHGDGMLARAAGKRGASWQSGQRLNQPILILFWDLGLGPKIDFSREIAVRFSVRREVASGLCWRYRAQSLHSGSRNEGLPFVLISAHRRGTFSDPERACHVCCGEHAARIRNPDSMSGRRPRGDRCDVLLDREAAGDVL